MNSEVIYQESLIKIAQKEHLLYEQSMYVKNQAKWQAATEFCKRKGLEFIILTEKHLK